MVFFSNYLNSFKNICMQNNVDDKEANLGKDDLLDMDK